MRLPIAPAVFLFTGAIVLACSQADLTAPNEDGLEPAFGVRGSSCPPGFTTVFSGDPLFDPSVDRNEDGEICYKKAVPGVRRKGLPDPDILIDNNLPLFKKK